MPELNDSQEDIKLRMLIQAFRTIYFAIVESKELNGLPIWHNFLLGKEWLPLQTYQQKLIEHDNSKKSSEEKANSNTCVAWALAQQHYDNCSEENLGLLNAIYKFVVMLPKSRLKRYVQKKANNYRANKIEPAVSVVSIPVEMLEANAERQKRGYLSRLFHYRNSKGKSAAKPVDKARVNDGRFTKKGKNRFSIFRKSRAADKSVEMQDAKKIAATKQLSLTTFKSKMLEETLEGRIMFSIYYHLANPIPLGEVWPVPRSELRL